MANSKIARNWLAEQPKISGKTLRFVVLILCRENSPTVSEGFREDTQRTFPALLADALSFDRSPRILSAQGVYVTLMGEAKAGGIDDAHRRPYRVK